MSASVAAIIEGPKPYPARRLQRDRRLPAPPLTLVAFALLAILGAVRWETMLARPPVGRMLGLVGLALAVLLLGSPLSDQARTRAVRVAAAAGIALAVLAMLPMAGLPLGWAVHVRLAVTARAIGHGLAGLPGVIVPYRGHVRAVRMVIALGAALLLLGSALSLAACRRPRGLLRLGAASLPLVVLAIVPSALARPRFAVLHGVLLFVLLVVFVFSERLAWRRGIAVAFAVGTSAVAAMALAPAIVPARSIIRFETTVVGGAGLRAGGETFDWAQTYGPLLWPHAGGTVLEVRASFPYYWKAEDLDVFDGRGWTAAATASGDPYAGVSEQALRLWTQRLTVTIRGMRSSNVIAAGTAEPPLLPGGAGSIGGYSPGTYVSRQPLVSGERYRVRVYTPAPTAAELSASGADYPRQIARAELQLQLPPGGGSSGESLSVPPQVFQFAPYGSASRLASSSGYSATEAQTVLSTSAYGPVLALVTRLEAGTSSPYAYVQAVLRYLTRGFTYSEAPPAAGFPILDFLLGHHVGYCQQFAGAMALMLRMGGVPARVAAGFATGELNQRRHEYVVTDIDAHAWVEAFFSGIGWVKLDPTPAADPALAGSVPPTPASTASLPVKGASAPAHQRPQQPRASSRARRQSSGAGSQWPVILLFALLAAGALAAGGRYAIRRRRPPTAAGLLEELERAFARCGRPLPAVTTLASLELRWADSPGAAAYLRALRGSRYAAGTEPPTPDGRRAVRRRLASGLGLLGCLRALIALPPRPGWSPDGRGLD